MRSDKALEMLNKGQIESLKEALRDEIYNEALKVRPRRQTTLCGYEKILLLHHNS